MSDQTPAPIGSIELLDCPFCGSKAERDPEYLPWVGCPNTDCPIHGNEWIDEEIWNRRPAPTTATQGVDNREALAALCHEQWSGWMRYLFGKCEILPNGDKGDLAVIPEWAVQRWKRQMETAYADLNEAEKDSDRKEADRILGVTHPQSTGREEAK